MLYTLSQDNAVYNQNKKQSGGAGSLQVREVPSYQETEVLRDKAFPSRAGIAHVLLHGGTAAVMQRLLGAREQGCWRQLPTNMVVIGTRLVSGLVKCTPGARERQLPSGMGPVDHAAQWHPPRL